MFIIYAAINVYNKWKKGESSWLLGKVSGTIVFCIIFLFILWRPLKERITNTPFMVISDSWLIINENTGYSEIQYRDVDEFRIEWTRKAKGGSNAYLSTVKRDSESITISEKTDVEGLTMAPEVLCDSLNKRLRRYKRTRSNRNKPH